MNSENPVHPTRALISRSSFIHNIQAVRTYIGAGREIMAVVKANAYGHGAIGLSRLALESGVSHLAVARVEEGLELRRAGIDAPILVFEIVRADMLETAIREDLQLTISTLENARMLDELAGHLRMKARVHIKIDTGMARLGFSHKDASSHVETIAGMKWVDVTGVYSHFATADDPEQLFARIQLDRFQNLLADLERKKIDLPWKHMANSGAIMALPESHFNMVRPGIMLYGYPPRRGMDQKHPLKPVMTLVSNVSLMKIVEARTSISYSRRYFTKQETRIATVPIGYADGYSRLLTGKGVVTIGKKKHPVAGTVCMDHIMVDVGDDDVHEGDIVTLFGDGESESISAWDIADQIGTIPYEVTCLITQRVPRMMAP